MKNINLNINLNGNSYTIIDNYKDCVSIDELESLFTEYFNDFDYVLGDYSYNKLRLKGFYDCTNKCVKKYNNIKDYKKYLEEHCATECPYFLIKKQINVEKQK